MPSRNLSSRGICLSGPYHYLSVHLIVVRVLCLSARSNPCSEVDPISWTANGVV
jgi:hypothetical protein